MIGWINLSVEGFICDSFGRDAWVQIVKEAHVDCNWVSSCPYPDKITYDLVITGAGILGVTVPQALEAYGQYFVNYVIKQGYTRLMKSLGSNIAEFLANLNNLHLHLTLGFPSMVAPAFRVEQVTSTSLLLHYQSIRPALWPIVSGVLKGASKVLFDHEVELELLHSRDAGDCDHEIFKVSYPLQPALAAWHNHDAALASEYGMTKDFFYEMFPFHIVLDSECRVVQCGSVVSRLFGETLTPGSLVADTFKLRHPFIPFEYDKILLEEDTLFLLKALQTGLEFKGQMVKTKMPDGREVLLFLGSPRVATLEEMNSHGLYLSDIPLHDMSRDFILLAEQRQAEADLKERFETLAMELKMANDRLEQATRWLDEEKQRSDALLYRMLPADIAADLREGRKVEAISYDEVTILFSDMVGFTNTSAKSTAEEVYNMLNEMYDRFDHVVDDFPDIYKLETIGDAYFLVCNLTTECDKHVDVVIDFAIRMQAAARHVKNAQGEPVQIRIGIHTGPVVGGVLGAKTPRFSIYGDTVNVASRMESHGLPGKIHISGESYSRIVDKYKYAVRERGNIAVKGRGNMQTYLIGGTNDDWLLRRTSVDNQIDAPYLSRSSTSSTSGPLSGLREGSFVILASAKSAENMNSNRSLQAMEAITEVDEDRSSRPNDGANSKGANAMLLTGFGSHSGNSPYSSTGGGGGVASASLVGFGGSSEAPLRSGTGELAGSLMGPPPMSPTPQVLGLTSTTPPLSASNSFREGGPPIGRDASFGAMARETSFGPGGRETSFRAVYARGGRPTGPNSPMASGGIRAQVGSANGMTGADSEGPTSGDSFGAASGLGRGISGTGAGFGSLPESLRPEGSGGSGIVMARSVTSKTSPLGPAGAAVAAAAAMAASAVAPIATMPTAAVAAAHASAGGGSISVRGASSPDGGMPSASMSASDLLHSSTDIAPQTAPTGLQAAILHQLRTTTLDGAPRRSSPGDSALSPEGSYGHHNSNQRLSSTGVGNRSSEMGGDHNGALESPATPSGKAKQLASKLKSLFKK